MASMHTTILFVVALALGLILVTGPLTSVAPVIQATTEGGSDDSEEESNNGDSSDEGGGEEGGDEGETDDEQEPPPPVVDEQPVTPGNGPEPAPPTATVEEEGEIEPIIECAEGMVLNEQGTKCIVDPEKAAATTLPPTEREPLPYCDIMNKDPNWSGSCHDRKDWDEITGLYPCNDGTQKADWEDCADATQKPPIPFPKPPSCKDFPKADKCHEDRKRIIVKFIKNVNIVKKINNSERGNGGDLDIKETLVAIDYDQGAGINCVFDEDDKGQCETFDVNKDKGKEPLLQVIDFDGGNSKS
jgi:hypothetical protein